MLLCLTLAHAAPVVEWPDPDPEPPFRPEPGQATWIGVTTPAVGLLPASGWPVAVGTDLDLRPASRLAWLQPELRVGIGTGIPTPGSSDAPDIGLAATFGARFGRDRGFYAGTGGGIGLTWSPDALHVTPAYVLYGGYAFAVRDGMRLSPELTLGSFTGVAVRVEWGRGS
jgi:hypothetical protein